MEGWVGWPIADSLPTMWSPINHRSGAWQESPPGKEWRPNNWATPQTRYKKRHRLTYTSEWRKEAEKAVPLIAILLATDGKHGPVMTPLSTCYFQLTVKQHWLYNPHANNTVNPWRSKESNKSVRLFSETIQCNKVWGKTVRCKRSCRDDGSVSITYLLLLHNLVMLNRWWCSFWHKCYRC